MIALREGHYKETLRSAFATVYWSKQEWHDSSLKHSGPGQQNCQIKLSHKTVLINALHMLELVLAVI